MPASKKRVKEIIEFSILNGKQKAMEAYGLPEDTFKRYQRSYKTYFGEENTILAKVREKFSDEQLEHLLTINEKSKKINTVGYDFSGEELTFLVITDTHYGSLYSDPARSIAAFKEAEKQNCSFMIHVGDVTEGHPNRPNSVYEMTHIGYEAQRNHSIEILQNWKKPMYLLSGNHDDFFNTKVGAGVHIVQDICNALPNAIFVGESLGTVLLPKYDISIGLFHGTDSGSAYALSWRLQRIINNLTPAQKPQVLLTGHDHKSFSMFYRNIHAVACGCLQKQSSWMASKGLQAMEGFYIIKMGVGNKEIKWFEPRFYPLYV